MNKAAVHIHLDPVGGISGNMFVGALLNMLPALAGELAGQLELAGFAHLVTLDSAAHTDGILTGTYFEVQELAQVPVSAVLNPAATVDTHVHRKWQDIRLQLQQSELDQTVKTHALGIFAALAEAEAAVHGTAVEEVGFHEVGAWDSIADIVCAAFLISRCGAHSWSVASLPTGRGTVSSAHGDLPLPAPAVLKLLQGFSFHDDGRIGERVTPTGAAILRYLQPTTGLPEGNWLFQDSGTGFGSKRFAGISNVLRAQHYCAADPVQQVPFISVITFMVDDQSPESLALALDYLRDLPGVVDVIQLPVFAKKGRLAQQVEILCMPEHQEDTIAQCLNHTSTLGLRVSRQQRVILERWMASVAHEGQQYRVKLARRPDGQFTAKAELDDLRDNKATLGQWEMLKQLLEQKALQQLEANRSSGQDA